MEPITVFQKTILFSLLHHDNISEQERSEVLPNIWKFSHQEASQKIDRLRAAIAARNPQYA